MKEKSQDLYQKIYMKQEIIFLKKQSKIDL